MPSSAVPSLTTTVHYGPGDEAAAEQLARYLDGAVELIESDDREEATLTLIPGLNFSQLRSVPLSLVEVREMRRANSGTTPTTASQIATTINGQGGPSTSRVGIVPVEAALDACS